MTRYFPVRYSCIKCTTETNTTSYPQHSHHCFEYLFPKRPSYTAVCVGCQQEIRGYEPKKFCSSSCAAKFNHNIRVESGWRRSAQSKSALATKVTQKHDSVRNALTSTVGDPAQKVFLDRVTRSPFTPITKCENCGKYFQSPGTGAKNCSRVCTHLIQSRKGRANKGLGTRRSKQEIELFKLCEQHFANVSANEKMFDGWDADILLHDHKIAVLWNGPWHYKQMNFSNHSLEQVQRRDRIKTKLFEDNGWRVKVFEDRAYTPTTAFVELAQSCGPSRG